jgi:phage gpG-like protein
MNVRNGRDFAALVKADMQKVLAQSPRAIGRLAINFMEDNFEKGGFQTSESGLRKWKPRKYDDGSGRGILIGKQSGRLQKSGTIFKADQKSVVVGVPDNIAEYGRIHNEGGTTHPKVTDKMRKFAWFKFKESDEKDERWKWLALTKKKILSIKIPRRQFLGNSPELNRRIKVFFNNAFMRNLKGSVTIK